jgi:hypothetical protein
MVRTRRSKIPGESTIGMKILVSGQGRDSDAAIKV